MYSLKIKHFNVTLCVNFHLVVISCVKQIQKCIYILQRGGISSFWCIKKYHLKRAFHHLRLLGVPSFCWSSNVGFLPPIPELYQYCIQSNHCNHLHWAGKYQNKDARSTVWQSYLEHLNHFLPTQVSVATSGVIARVMTPELLSDRPTQYTARWNIPIHLTLFKYFIMFLCFYVSLCLSIYKYFTEAFI